MIKISKDFLKRNYYTNKEVIYKINNSKKDVNVNDVKINIDTLPYIEVKSSKKKIYADTGTEAIVTASTRYYIDSLIEDGDIFTGTEFKKINGLSIISFFIKKCEDVLKDFLLKNVTATINDIKSNKTSIPVWMINGYEENDGTSYEILTDGVSKLNIELKFEELKNEMIEESIIKYGNELYEKYNITPKEITFK